MCKLPGRLYPLVERDPRKRIWLDEISTPALKVQLGWTLRRTYNCTLGVWTVQRIRVHTRARSMNPALYVTVGFHLFPLEEPDYFNILRPKKLRHFADGIFKSIFFNENVWILVKNSRPINNIPPLVQIVAWCLPGNKPLSEPMMVRLPTHICVTQPQLVKQKIHQIVHHSRYNSSWSEPLYIFQIHYFISETHIRLWNI